MAGAQFDGVPHTRLLTAHNPLRTEHQNQRMTPQPGVLTHSEHKRNVPHANCQTISLFLDVFCPVKRVALPGILFQ